MSPLRRTNRRGTLLASPIQTPSLHDALLVVDLSNPSYRRLGRFIRTGSTPVAAPELYPGAGCHSRHHRLAEVKGSQELGGVCHGWSSSILSVRRPLACEMTRACPKIALEALGLGKALFEDEDDDEDDYERHGARPLAPGSWLLAPGS
jgi:hypothetical protein